MSTADSSGAIVVSAKQTLISSIRNWIHFDNLYENHMAQAINARKLRAKHEQEAIAALKDMKLDKSVIQVSGASLSLQKKQVASGLTWGFLEKQVAAWASSSPSPALNPSQVQSLLQWLRTHREVKETETLRKLKPDA